MKTGSLTIDSNVFLRSADRSSLDFEAAKNVLISLAGASGRVLVSTQVIHECWVVLTRPREVNGFGLSTDDALEFVGEISRLYRVRHETKRCFTTWLQLVREYQVKGPRAHDARLAAWMITNGIDKIITFNVSDFAGFPILVIHPADAGY